MAALSNNICYRRLASWAGYRRIQDWGQG